MRAIDCVKDDAAHAAVVFKDGRVCGYKVLRHSFPTHSMGNIHFGGLRPDDPRIRVEHRDFATFADAQAWVEATIERCGQT